MRRTKEQAAETGRQILNAAERLFLERTYDAVSLEDIAAAAGVTRGAVHWHFRNKQGLLLALRDRATGAFRQLADELADDVNGASLDRLGELLCSMFAELHADPRQKGLLRVMLPLDLSPPDPADDSDSRDRHDVQLAFTRIFEAAEKASGLPPPWTPATAASMLCATVYGLIFEWALGRSRSDLVPDGQAFIRMVLSNWRAAVQPPDGVA